MAENGKNKPAVDNDGWTPVWEDKPKKAGAIPCDANQAEKNHEGFLRRWQVVE